MVVNVKVPLYPGRGSKENEYLWGYTFVIIFWSYALPSWVIKIPVSFLDVVVWTITTYYVVWFYHNASRK